jgi:hypothetical protein
LLVCDPHTFYLFYVFRSHDYLHLFPSSLFAMALSPRRNNTPAVQLADEQWHAMARTIAEEMEWPIEAFPDDVREWVAAYAGNNGVHDELFLLPLLGLVNGLTRTNAVVNWGRQYVAPTLYTIGVCVTGSRKTNIFKLFSSAVVDLQQRLRSTKDPRFQLLFEVRLFFKVIYVCFYNNMYVCTH